MNIVVKKLSELKQAERNIRMHPEKQIVEYCRSLDANGQLKLIVIDEDNVIWIGNGLYEAMMRRGDTEAYCLVKTGMSEADKIKMMMADNKIFGLGVDDLETFDFFLDELKGEEDGLNIPGFDESLLRSMVAQAGEVSEKLQEYGTLDDDEIEEIKSARERKDLLMTSGVEDAGEDETESAAADGEREPVRKYVVCPHCGEKVWL